MAQIAGQRGDYRLAGELLKQRLVISHGADERSQTPDALEGVAWAAAVLDDLERATRLYAAADALRGATGWPLLGERRMRYERRLARLRDKLGEASFAAAWTAGRTLSLDQAVDLALANPESGRSASASRPMSLATDALSRREQEVAALLAKGLTNREIAEALIISERTANVHVQHILAKLELRSRWQVRDWLADSSRKSNA